MEQFLNENMYVIDLGEVNSAPEIIFELSSILDKDEVKNRRICLKLGNVDLNQAQLLSIKSLINGIDSTLSCIDTKSVETEKVALSIGLIVANVSEENTSGIVPTPEYKTAEELKEEMQTSVETEQEIILEEYRIVEETEQNTTNEETFVEEQSTENTENIENNIENIENTEQQENIQNDNVIQFTSAPAKEDVKDELDVIFGSEPINGSVFEMEVPKEIYKENDVLTDIVVPENEFTKEDIELESFPTKYIKQTIRSGQVINYEGNIVIIGDCHPGCEITAFGDITVWGILSGIAHAGAGGNQKARVRALKMNAIQLRIANCYSRRPDSLNTVFIEKTNSFTPEEARVINGEIVVFKIND